MKIGIVGLGKLGLPCAVAMDQCGHDVMGYDIRPELLTKEPRAYRETASDGISPFNPVLAQSNLQFGTLAEVVDFADLIFVAVQTPHEPRFEGITRLPDERVDFDYQHLEGAVRNLSEVVSSKTPIVIISTVLPGTVRNRLLPLANPNMRICYNPFFIAMGTTMRDFLDPEFVLLGVHDDEAADLTTSFYKTITTAPVYATSVENAELIKVAYNTFIGMKIVFANTMMEICAKTPGTDVDAVTGGLKLAHRRLISPSYMNGGMGDGGGCHPRDNIAMSHLARSLDLSYDLFESLMLARERQTEWLARLLEDNARRFDLPVILLGKAFKEQTNISVGSPALLLATLLDERGIPYRQYDPHIDTEEFQPTRAIYFMATNHPEFLSMPYPPGSVVLDPWGAMEPRPGISVLRIGRAGSSPEFSHGAP